MLYTEITPNPASLKFVVSRQLMAQGTADFPDKESTEDAPIANKLFDFRFVERVFIGQDLLPLPRAMTSSGKALFLWSRISSKATSPAASHC